MGRAQPGRRGHRLSAQPRSWGAIRLPAALGTIYVVWGSTYLAIRIMVETLPPLLSAGVRFATAGAVFWAVLRLRGGARRVRVTRRQAGYALVAGSLLCFGGNGLVTVAEQEVPSGLAALIIGAVPLWVVTMRMADGDRVPPGTLAGVALGFIGLAVLVLPGDRPGGAPLWGVLMIVAASISWAAGSYYSKRMDLPPDALVSTALQMLLGGGAMVVAGLLAGETGDVHFAEFSGRSLAAFGYLIVFGSLLAFTAYTWLLQNAPISTVATYAYVNPVIAVALGALVLSEEITLTVLVGTVAIVASVAAVVRRESGPAMAGETTPARTGRPWRRRG
ncbi:MAG: EamA family transporter [Actinomycetota bacterium]|nr:EamA family transporter [Actinomycetota bacterium]